MKKKVICYQPTKPTEKSLKVNSVSALISSNGCSVYYASKKCKIERSIEVDNLSESDRSD